MTIFRFQELLKNMLRLCKGKETPKNMYSIMNITTLYVSQEYGNDGNRGVSANIEENGTGPLKTIEKAFEIVAQIRLFGAVQPITIRILDSVYIRLILLLS